MSEITQHEPEIRPLIAEEIEDRTITQQKAINDVKQLEKKDWSISVNLKDEIGQEQKENAATLMHHVSEGAADVVKAVARRGRLPANYRVPRMRIGDNSGIDASYRFSVNREGGQSAKITSSEIVIDSQGINVLAQDDPSTVYEIDTKNKDGTRSVTVIGTPAEIAYTTGAEEMAHSIFAYQDVENGKYRPNEVRGNNMESLAAYDAQPMEYHGRGWQVRAILDARNEGKITAEEAERQARPFIDRIQAAAKYRRERKSSE